MEDEVAMKWRKMKTDAEPPAAAAAAVDDDFATRTLRFFDLINDGNIQQLRVLIDSLDADELNTLLRRTVDPVERVTRTGSALWSAFFRHHWGIVELLLEKGADPNEPFMFEANDLRMTMDLFDRIPHISSSENAIQFLRERGILRSVPPRCPLVACQRQMTEVKLGRRRRSGGDDKAWRCPTHQIKSNQFVTKFVAFMYLWAHGVSLACLQSLCGISKPTAIDWAQFTRDICSRQLLNNPIQLVGPGIVVQIDESLMSKRKYHVGHQIPERWIFGMYDTDQKLGVLEFVDDRRQETLFPIIRRYVRGGSIIHSDSATMYVILRADPPQSHIANIPTIPMPPYDHLFVNHTTNFVDPTTGACTNLVECFWKNAKQKNKAMSGTSAELLPSYLDEFQWRQLRRTSELCQAQRRRDLTPLFSAVRHANLELCRVLVARGANVDLGTDSAITPLMIAAWDRSQTEIVTFLVENGANINLQTGDGVTALMYACYKGNVDIVRLLLSHGANVELTDFEGFRFALKDAATEGHLEVCRLLVEEWAADVNQQTIQERYTPVICAASRGHLATVDFLVEHGADLQHVDVDGHMISNRCDSTKRANQWPKAADGFIRKILIDH
ncbi:hypothetical protein niasHS_015450 [Heterodera schachtii]|uniref:ISXO2-like transposase domain-containing protein n=1 Tax=Heterodera schachtii TaxID=97005 RepID=A0ABD2HUP3_HETSC